VSDGEDPLKRWNNTNIKIGQLGGNLCTEHVTYNLDLFRLFEVAAKIISSTRHFINFSFCQLFISSMVVSYSLKLGLHQIHFSGKLCQGIIKKDHTVWLEGAKPPPLVKLDLSLPENESDKVKFRWTRFLWFQQLLISTGYFIESISCQIKSTGHFVHMVFRIFRIIPYKNYQLNKIIFLNRILLFSY